MSLESVRKFFAEHAPGIEIIEMSQSAATVTQAANAHGFIAGQIAKTLSLKIKQQVILIVMRCDRRLDNKKLMKTFKAKARMLTVDEVILATGHPVGGVCPFGLEQPLAIYCDRSLTDFAEVLSAAGAIHSAVRLSPQRLADLTNATWIDVCQEP